MCVFDIDGASAFLCSTFYGSPPFQAAIWFKWVDVFFDLYCMFSLRTYYKKKGISPNLQSASVLSSKNR